jgi:uncharacterized protein with ParB-like and HNH nuclease domain
MKKTFKELKKFPDVDYTVNVSWNYLRKWVDDQIEELSLQLNPDFQRGHVWTRDQQIAYVEFVISGGGSGRELFFNHPGWGRDFKGDFVLVDGLQRITTVLAFMNNEIPAFGILCSDFDGKVPHEFSFTVHVASLKTKNEVLDWYLLMNAGGTPHSKEEIERVRKMREG